MSIGKDMKDGPAEGRNQEASGQEGVGPDGSMEDILASIRRILAEDQAGPAPAGAEPGAEPGGEDVLDLTEQMLAADAPKEASASKEAGAPEEAASQETPSQASAGAATMSAAEVEALFDAPSPSPPLAAAAPPAEPPPAVPPLAAAPTTPPPAAPETLEAGLIGGGAAAAAAASFAALRAASRGQGGETRVTMPDIPLGSGAVTLEQMVREELRPILKAWLEANLPALVERLVKAELERVARG